MKKKILDSFFLLFTVAITGFTPLATSAFGKEGVKKRSYFFEDAGMEMEYSLFVPGSYDKKKSNPLLVVLHGLGSNPGQVIRYAGITGEAEKRGYVVVAPFGYNSRGWYGSHGKGRGYAGLFGGKNDPGNLGELSEKDVMNVLGIVRREFSIDDERIFLMGHSMGGGGTVYLGSKYPDIWAGLAPLAPAVAGNRSILEKMRHIPVIVVTGEKDRLVRVEGVRHWVAKMKELKMDFVYNEIEGGNHFDTIARNPAMIAEVFDFFEGKRPELNGKIRETTSESEPGFRVLSNRSGWKIKARVVAVTGDKVTIIRQDGRTYALPVSLLSDADQEYIGSWSAEKAKEQSGRLQ